MIENRKNRVVHTRVNICYLLFSFFYLQSAFLPSFSQTQKTDSLLHQLETLNTKPETFSTDTTRINLLNKLANEYRYTAPDTALIYAEQALALAEKTAWHKGIANSHHTIGNAYYVQGNYEKTLFHWQKALEIRKSHSDKKDISASLGSIGIVYHEQGNYPKALSCYFKALEMDSVIGNKRGIAFHLGNIGNVYNAQGNYPKALFYYFKALEMDSVMLEQAERSGNPPLAERNKRNIAIWLGNIGSVYYEQGNYPKVHPVKRDSLFNRALSCYFKALEMDSMMGNKSGIAIRLGNIGIVYSEQASAVKSRQDIAGSDSLFKKAIDYYFRALTVDEELGDKNGIAIKLGNIGTLYTEMKQYAQAEKYLLQSLALSDSIGTLYYTMTFEKSICELYAQTHKWQNAYNHHILYSNAKDTIFGEEKSKAVGRVEMKHEMEMEEYLRKQEEKAVVAALAAATTRRNLLQYSLILLVLGVLFAVVLFSRRLMAKLPDRISFGSSERSRTAHHTWKVNKAKVGFAFIFVFIMMLFESMLLFADPYITGYAQGAPGVILLLNALLACILFPLNFLLEKVLVKKVGSQKPEDGSRQPPSNATGMLLGLMALVVFNSFISGDSIKQTSNQNEQLNNRTIEHLNASTTLSTNIRTKADSLINELSHAKEDTQKVNLLIAIGWELRIEDEKQAMNYLNKGLKLAEEIHDERGKALLYATLASLHYNHGNYPAAIENHLKALKIDSILKNEKGISRHLGNIGIVYKEQGDYPKALSYYFKAFEMDSVMGNKNGVAINLGRIGIVYYEQGNYPKALSYYFKALEMDSVMGNKREIAIKLGNIGIVYYAQGDYPKALSYYFMALEMDSVMGNKNGVARHLGNIGIVYMEQGNYPKALSYYFKALEMDSVLGNKRNIAAWLGNIGIVYDEQGDYPKALSYYFKALEMDSVMGNKRNIAAWIGNIGSLYTSIKQYAQAEKYLKQALTFSDSIGALHHTMSIEKSICELYAQTYKWQNAYEHHVAYRTARDSVFGEEKSKAIGRVEMKHELEMAEYRRKVEEEEKRRQEAAAVGRRNELQYGAIFIGFIVLLSAIFMLSRIVLPVWFIEFLTFVPFLILFEFILVLLDPYIDALTAGAPALRLLFNALVAGMLYPLQQFAEDKLKMLFRWRKRRKVRG